jgi:hypothetical protein
MLRLNGTCPMIKGSTMTKKMLGLIALVSLCSAFTSGYMAAAEKATQPSSGYKLLYVPADRVPPLTGQQGISRDVLKGCAPISISSYPDPKDGGLLILCKG